MKRLLLAAVILAAPATAIATPILLNVPLSMIPGNVVAVTGQNFDNSSTVTVTPLSTGTAVPVPVKLSDTHAISFEVPSSLPFDIYTVQVTTVGAVSNIYQTNLPLASSFDQPDLYAGQQFRIFGRNLYVPGDAEPLSVALVDQSTNAVLPVSVIMNLSSAYDLCLTAPSGIVAGHTYKATITKGSYVAASLQSVTGHSSGGTDYFNLGVAWGQDFLGGTSGTPGPSTCTCGPNNQTVALNINSFNVKMDPRLATLAVGDGVTDDTAAIQGAINAAAALGGGLVYLPPGTYRLASPNNGALFLRSGVALQGHSRSDTFITYGPTSNQGSGYVWYGFNFIGVTLSGFADVTVTDVDTLSQTVSSFVSYNHSSKLFLQRVSWNTGTGRWLTTTTTVGDYTDRFVISNSNITGAINLQMPVPAGVNGASCVGMNVSGGPAAWFNNVTNFWFHNNAVYSYSGGVYLNAGNNILEENNVFTRDAGDKIQVTSTNINCFNQDYYENPISVGQYVQRQITHETTMGLANNATIQNNSYVVVDGTLTFNWVDGETIVNEEPGGLNQDSGTVVSATATTVAGNSQTWSVPAAQPYLPGEMIAIIKGTGWGQMRNVTSFNSATNTFTVDRVWDIIPAAGDVIAVFMPGYQNALIRNNAASGNPAGILLWNTAFINASILNNQMTDNGCILVQTVQIQHKPAGGAKLGYLNGIEINNNTCTNTRGLYPSYIAVDDAIVSPATIQGTAGVNVDVRNNSVLAYGGTTPRYYNKDGSFYFYTQNDTTTYTAPTGFVPSLIGGVFENNNCTNCASNYTISGGIYDLTIWNSFTNGALAPPATTDTLLGGVRSVNTTTGHD